MKYAIIEPVLPGFKYGLSMENMLDFHAARQWLSQTYGHEAIDHWSRKLEYHNYILYLKSDNELGWFKLKFGG